MKTPTWKMITPDGPGPFMGRDIKVFVFPPDCTTMLRFMLHEFGVVLSLHVPKNLGYKVSVNNHILTDGFVSHDAADKVLFGTSLNKHDEISIDVYNHSQFDVYYYPAIEVENGFLECIPHLKRR